MPQDCRWQRVRVGIACFDSMQVSIASVRMDWLSQDVGDQSISVRIFTSNVPVAGTDATVPPSQPILTLGSIDELCLK